MGLEPTTSGITIRYSNQLSYAHRKTANYTIPKLARPTGIEPATAGLEGRCSIRLSYGRIDYRSLAYVASVWPHHYGRGRGIRTLDIQLPKLALYQAELYPEVEFSLSSIPTRFPPRNKKGCVCTLANLARPERFELPTTKFVAWYSIQLSYGREESRIIPLRRHRVNP
jgi:hypothetical protein